MIRRFLATKPKFGSSTAPPTVPVKGFHWFWSVENTEITGKYRVNRFWPNYGPGAAIFGLSKNS